MNSRLILLGAGLLAVAVVLLVVLLPDDGPIDDDLSGPGSDAATAEGASDSTPEGPPLPVAPPDADPALVLDRALRRAAEVRRGELGLAVEELLPFTRSEEGVARLLDVLRTSEDPDRKALVLLALGQSPLEAGKNLVLDAARGDFGGDLRAPALLVLGEDRRPETTRFLGEVAAEGEDPVLAASAVQALVFQNRPESHREIARVLERRTDPELRRYVWIAMSGEAVPGPPGETGIAAGIRFAVSTVLVPVADEPASAEALERIVGQARSERTPDGRMFAAAALLSIPGEETSAAFRELWPGLEPPMREMMVGRIRPGFSESKIPGILTAAASEPEIRVRRILADRATEFGSPEHLPALERWLASETDPEIRRSLEATIRAVRDAE